MENPCKTSYIMKQDCVIGDATAACRLVLWEGRIGALEQDSTYKFSELLVLSYNSKYVSIAEQTPIMQADDLGKVEANTVEEKKISGEICNVLQCEDSLIPRPLPLGKGPGAYQLRMCKMTSKISVKVSVHYNLPGGTLTCNSNKQLGTSLSCPLPANCRFVLASYVF